MCLNVGGDDITEYLFALLQHMKFPYREADLSRAYDWKLLEDLKCKICTLAEVFLFFLLPFRDSNSGINILYVYLQTDVAMNINDFVIRRPRKPTQKYTFRAYNEIILAPMVNNHCCDLASD